MAKQYLLDDPGPPNPNLANYSFRLGRFVTVFASTEKLLFLVSGLVMRIPLSVTQAVFGGGAARVKDTIDRVNRTMKATVALHPDNGLALDLQRVFSKIFLQLGLINSTRNEILHYGIHANEDGAECLVSNEHLKPDAPDKIRISAPLLDAMSADLRVITFVLMACNYLCSYGMRRASNRSIGWTGRKLYQSFEATMAL